jgi:LacI family transcriptional regulator
VGAPVSGTTIAADGSSPVPEDVDVPRGPRATIRDVARLAGVTASTVSRALDPDKHELVNEATRARIEQVVREIDYRPNLGARNLRRGRTMTVGVVVPDLANPIFAPFARGIAHALESEGHLALLADTQDDHGRLLNVLEQLVERRVAAIIVAAGRAVDAAALMDVNSQGTPVICAIRRPRDMAGVVSVGHDDRAGVALAVRHLYDLGHRRIAQVRGPEDIEPFPTRASAFDCVMRDLGLEPVRVVEPTPQIGLACAREATERLVGGDPATRPTAIFVPNDTMSLGALDALSTAGLRCPEDVSIVSYNDVFFAPYVNPPLTAVHLPVYEIGHICGELALRLAADPSDTPSGAIATPPPVLRVRASSGPAPTDVR